MTCPYYSDRESKARGALWSHPLVMREIGWSAEERAIKLIDEQEITISKQRAEILRLRNEMEPRPELRRGRVMTQEEIAAESKAFWSELRNAPNGSTIKAPEFMVKGRSKVSGRFWAPGIKEAILAVTDQGRIISKQKAEILRFRASLERLLPLIDEVLLLPGYAFYARYDLERAWSEERRALEEVREK